MTDWIFVFVAIVGAIAGWIFKGFLASRSAEKLKTQRDTALREAEQQRINVVAKAAEAAAMRKQQATEDAIHESDNNGISGRLDNLFK
jgi:uncharacterized membrane-anchored protein YhcB (DUF1043 family)